MNGCSSLTSDKNFENVFCSNQTYLNRNDISKFYEMIKGQDMIKRIYDLYNGVIDSNNEWDIHMLHLGLLNQEVFDIKKSHGITQKEDELVGETFENAEENYIQYLKQLLSSRYGYKEEINLEQEKIGNESKKILKKVFGRFLKN